MLVLSRKAGESIELSDGVVVEVLEIRGDKVRLGLTADPSIKIYRHEIAEAIRNSAAVTAATNAAHAAVA